MDFEVRRALRVEGVREITGREIQVVALQAATETPEQVAEKFLELRRDG